MQEKNKKQRMGEMKLSFEENVEAWRYTCKKYSGTKVKDNHFWLNKKMQDPVYWIMNGNKLVDQCNVYLDEISWLYGGEDEG